MGEEEALVPKDHEDGAVGEVKHAFLCGVGVARVAAAETACL